MTVLKQKSPLDIFSKSMDYQDRHRAEGFGSLADQYERTRLETLSELSMIRTL
jgi:hypothetical protein